jgi:hypothetical protein
MKLVRFDDDKTGLVVELSSGPHVVDVVASIGALIPGDPISHGVLTGLLKDNGSWAPLIQHWKMARSGLRGGSQSWPQTAGSSQIVLRRLDDLKESSVQPDRINRLDIGELNATSQDPTGREAMERKFAETRPNPTGRGTVATPITERIIQLSNVRTIR